MSDATDTTMEVARVLAEASPCIWSIAQPEHPYSKDFCLDTHPDRHPDVGYCWVLPTNQAKALADAGLLRETTASAEPCDAETWSMDHYRDGQVDRYWIRCTQLGPHTEHEDSNTGLTWPREAETPAAPEPPRRLRACVENWPDAETGAYHPSCCRFPKSCSAAVYDEERVTEADLEPRTPTSDEGARA